MYIFFTLLTSLKSKTQAFDRPHAQQRSVRLCSCIQHEVLLQLWVNGSHPCLHAELLFFPLLIYHQTVLLSVFKDEHKSPFRVLQEQLNHTSVSHIPQHHKMLKLQPGGKINVLNDDFFHYMSVLLYWSVVLMLLMRFVSACSYD